MTRNSADPYTHRPILLTGHSHTLAMGVPGLSSDRQPELVPISERGDGVYGVTGGWPRDEAYWAYVTQLAPQKTVVISWNGNQHAEFFFKATPEFDFYVERLDHFGVTPDAVLVPCALVREYFQTSIDELRGVLKTLNSLNDVEVIVLGTPPPKKSDEHLRSRLASERYFIAMAARLGLDIEQVELTRPAVRAKMWLVIQELLAKAASDHLCRFLPSPEECIEEGCYLRGEFAAPDVTHANTAYGSVVWENLLRLSGR